MHQCPDILSAHHFLQVAVGVHIEYDDREVVLFTHRGSGQVHYLQAPGIDLIIRNIGELGSRKIFLRISGVNTVHTGTFQHDIRLDLDASQGRSGIRSKERYRQT